MGIADLKYEFWHPCQNSYRKQGSSQVLAAFQAKSLPAVAIAGCRCLGQCGSGPMVLVLPDEVWYGQVHPDEVPAVLERHLRQGQPVERMLYRKLHFKPELKQFSIE